VRIVLTSAVALMFATSAGVSERCVDYGLLLDPGTTSEVRTVQLERLEHSAKAGSALANFVLGSLLRLGPEHPSAATPADPVRAQTLLARAAVGGRFEAMPALGEIERARGDVMKAHLWAALGRRFQYRHGYTMSPIHYHHVGDLERRLGRQASGLIQGKGKQGQLALEYQGGFITKYGDSIDAGARHWPALGIDACAGADPGKWPLVWDKSAVPDRRNAPPGRRTKRWMNAVFYLEVAPDGRVTRQHLIDGWPTAALASRLQPTLRFIRFNAIDAGGPVRAAIMPVSDDGRLLRLATLGRALPAD
jgi:hypothetical protein